MYREDGMHRNAQNAKNSVHYLSKAWSIVMVILVTSLIWLIIIYNLKLLIFQQSQYTDPPSSHNITSNARLLECGNSTQEAKSRGCEYDLLLNSWVPAPCIDHEFVDEYLDDNSWAAYADEALTQRLSSSEEIAESDFYFTSLKDHINHCAMIWKKQFWVLYKQYSAFDTIIASEAHTDHCALFLADARNVDVNQATRVEKGYAGCWIRG